MVTPAGVDKHLKTYSNARQFDVSFDIPAVDRETVQPFNSRNTGRLLALQRPNRLSGSTGFPWGGIGDWVSLAAGNLQPAKDY